MKKITSIFFMVMVAGFTHAQPVPPVKVADCPAIDQVPELDGKDDEGFWSPEQTLTIFNLSAAEDWTGETDYNITFKMAFGWLYFYTYVIIKDDVNHSWNGEDGNAYEFDNVEWFFQLDTQTVPTTYTDNTVQIRFNRGKAGFQSSTFRNGISKEDFWWYSENTPEGWVLECAIPWTNVMPNGTLPEDLHDWIEQGRTIGFDLQGADSDGTDPLIGDKANGTQMAWDEDGEPGNTADGTEDIAWNNTSVFGYLCLAGGCNPVWISGSDRPFIEDNTTTSEIELIPNPVKDYLRLKSPKNHQKIKIYSLTGELILESEKLHIPIDVSLLMPGVYIAVFDNTEAVKFVKE